MKKALSCVLLGILVFLTGIPALAQKARSVRNSIVRAEPVQFEKVEAFSEGQGVFLRWITKSEIGNVGFYIYRTTVSGTVLVNDAMVMGTSAMSTLQTNRGDTYEFFDPDGNLRSTYTVQSLTLNGDRVSAKPVTPRFSFDLAADTGRSSDSLALIEKTKSPVVEAKELTLTPELEIIVQASLLEPDLNIHRWVVSQPGSKIGVKKDGIYRVNRSQLPAAIFNDTNSANWRLFLEGNEQAIIVGAGDQYIEFYGKGLDTVDNDTRIYYLLADSTPGRRITTKLMTPLGGNVVSPNSKVIVETKEKTSYVSAIQNGPLDNYWGPIITNAPTTIEFNLSALDTAVNDATINVKMQGYSYNQQNISATVNGNLIGTFSGNNRDIFSSGEISIPRSFLVEGVNSLQLSTDASNAYSLFDSVIVRYARKYNADANKTGFATPGYRKVSVGGFSTANIRIFDTTYDGNPQQIINLPIEQIDGAFTIKMPSYRPGLFYVMDDSAFLAPASVTTNNGSTLSVNSNQADMLIISHSAPDFINSANNWANYRRSAAGGSFNVKVVDVADIYDEFSYGLNTSAAISSFFNYAYNNWQLRPRYVLLLGDGSRDPRNYEGDPGGNLIPTKLINLIYFESGSDEALGDFDGDGLSEIAIGRVTARNSATINVALIKTMNFETAENQNLDRGAVLAFQQNSTFDFEGMSLAIRDELPSTMERLLIGSSTGGQTTLVNQLNRGKFIVNYSGHGAETQWASNFFNTGAVPNLTNIDNPTIFTMLTCLNGYFIRPNGQALVEPLLSSPTGGAVASWASTTDTTPDIQLPMAIRFYNRLGAGTIPRIGDLIRDAKTAIPYGSDVRFSWTLFGDPALKVR